MYSSSSDPSSVKNPRRSSAIYIYVTESMIKFLLLYFSKCRAFTHLHRVFLNFYLFLLADEWLLYLQSLTRVQTVL